jgi:hypothetical protein
MPIRVQMVSTLTPDWSDLVVFLPSKRVPKSKVTLRTASLLVF